MLKVVLALVKGWMSKVRLNTVMLTGMKVESRRVTPLATRPARMYWVLLYVLLSTMLDAVQLRTDSGLDGYITHGRLEGQSGSGVAWTASSVEQAGPITSGAASKPGKYCSITVAFGRDCEPSLL